MTLVRNIMLANLSNKSDFVMGFVHTDDNNHWFDLIGNQVP